jgi:NAD-specific glutamate dehydrogenase
LARLVSLYRLFDQMFDAGELWSGIRASGRLPHRLEIELLLGLEDAVAELCRWGLVRSRRLRLDEETISRWRDDWMQYRESLAQSISAADQQSLRSRVDALTDQGLSPDVAGSLVWIDRVEEFPSVVELKRRSGYTLREALQLYRRVAQWFGWGHIAASLKSHPADPTARLAHRALRNRLFDAFLRLSLSSIGVSGHDPERFLDGLRQQGQLARVGWIRNDLMGASPSRALDLLVVLMADAEAAADDCTDPLAQL